jgi:Coenzyme PQQ synthesis protein D (PqqD)
MSAESVRRLRPAPSVHTRLFDGELVILDLAAGEYLTLDAIGSTLWKGLEAGRSVDEVAREVVAEYEVSVEQATADLEALVDDFVARGLFVVDEADR